MKQYYILKRIAKDLYVKYDNETDAIEETTDKKQATRFSWKNATQYAKRWNRIQAEEKSRIRYEIVPVK